MTTATRAKRGSALTELETLEAKWAAAAEARRDIGRQHQEKQNALRELLERRTRLLTGEPGQFNHDGSPLTDDNNAAEIQRAIDALGQTDFTSEIAHLERLETAAKNVVHVHIEGHIAEIVDELRPAAEAVAAAVQDTLGPARAAVDAYLNMVRRSEGLTHAVRGLDVRAVPGLDPAAELQRVLQGWDLPVPLPELDR